MISQYLFIGKLKDADCQTDSPRLLIFQRLMYLIKLTSQSALEVDGRITGTLDEHKKYFDYLKAGNGDKAYSILIDHLMMPLNVVKPEK